MWTSYSLPSLRGIRKKMPFAWSTRSSAPASVVCMECETVCKTVSAPCKRLFFGSLFLLVWVFVFVALGWHWVGNAVALAPLCRGMRSCQRFVALLFPCSERFRASSHSSRRRGLNSLPFLSLWNFDKTISDSVETRANFARRSRSLGSVQDSPPNHAGL